MLRSSMILAVAVVVLGGCQQTTIETAGSTVEMEEPAATVELSSSQQDSSAIPAAPAPLRATASQAVPAANDRAVPAPRPVERPGVPAATAPQPVPAAAPRPADPVPPPRPVVVTVPTRTILPVELEKTLSSHSSQVGESFRSILVQDVAVDGRVVFPRGSVVIGTVTEAKPAKKVGGRARLSLEFYSLELSDGRQVPLEVVFAEAGRSQTAKDAAIIGGSTLGGAVIGRAVDKGEGTAVGAIVGGLAGAAVANETRAKPVVVNAGTRLSLETTAPITVEVEG